MTTPSIYSIDPAIGHTGGQQLVEIAGANFATRDEPSASAALPLAEPTPSVKVTIGGEECLAVWVLSSGLLRALTPRHDPSGLPARDAIPEKSLPARDAIAASDVVVQNLDADGAPIVGELATLPAAFSFVRPNLSTPGALASVMRAFLAELARQVCENVDFNPHTDYDPDTADGLNIAKLATLPGLAVLDLKLPESVQQRNEQGEDANLQTVAPEHGAVLVRRSGDFHDAVFSILGVSENQSELMTLFEALKGFFRKNPLLYVRRDPANPSSEFAKLQIEIDASSIEFTGRIEESNVLAFSVPAAIRRIPIGAIPGLPTTTIPGVLTDDPTEDIIDITNPMKRFGLKRGPR